MRDIELQGLTSQTNSVALNTRIRPSPTLSHVILQLTYFSLIMVTTDSINLCPKIYWPESPGTDPYHGWELWLPRILAETGLEEFKKIDRTLGATKEHLEDKEGKNVLISAKMISLTFESIRCTVLRVVPKVPQQRLYDNIRPSHPGSMGERGESWGLEHRELCAECPSGSTNGQHLYTACSIDNEPGKR